MVVSRNRLVLCFSFFFIWLRRPTSSILFPYTTLFRSHVRRGARHVAQPRDAQAHAAVGKPAVGELRRSEEHTSELQSRSDLVCRLLLEKKKLYEQSSLGVRRRSDTRVAAGAQMQHLGC